MKLLRRKNEKTETISIRVPGSVRTELDELRKQADAAGFDLTATLTEALVRLTKQLREELSVSPEKERRSERSAKVNGLTEGSGLG